MKNIGQLIADVLEKAGYDVSEDKFKDLVSLTTKVESDVEKAFNGMVSVESAHEHPVVKKKAQTQAMATVDAKIKAFVSEIKDKKLISDEALASVETERSAYKQLDLLFSEINGIEIKAGGEATKLTDEEKEAYVTQINDYKKKLAEAQTEITNTKNMSKAEIEAYKRDKALEVKLLGFKWSDAFDKDDRLDIANIAIKKELQAKGAKLEYIDGVFALKSEDGSDIYDSTNKKVEFESFLNEIMQKKKFIAVNQNDSENNHNRSQPHTVVNTQSQENTNTGLLNSVISSYNDASGKK